MNQGRSSEKSESQNTKRRKLNSGKDQNKGAAGVASLEIEQNADILKLDIDCCEEAFDYLQICDLLSVGLTCKRLNRVVSYILEQNYSGLSVEIRKHGYEKCLVKHFNQFIKSIECCGNDCSEQMINDDLKFTQLKHIRFFDLISNEPESFLQILQSKDILKRLEYLEFNCELDGNFHDSVLAFCSNIKRLCVYSARENREDPLIGNSNDWLHRKYPTLEHFECHSFHYTNIGEVIAFLQLNPNIINLSVKVGLLEGSEQSEQLMNSNVKLNKLKIDVTFPRDITYQLLKKHSERGIYKRLELLSWAFVQNDIDQLESLNTLVKLILIWEISEPVKLSCLNSLEDLLVPSTDNITDWSDLPTKLTKLERIHIIRWSTSDILPFISQAKNLKKIRLMRQFYRANYVIDLAALNKEREKLDEACKVTIYVKDSVYLATKWAMKETDFSLIRLRRIGSFEWDDCYSVILYGEIHYED